MTENTWGNADPKQTSKETPVKASTVSGPERVETLYNNIYYYSGINDERILDLNKQLKDVSLKNQSIGLINSIEPPPINLHIQSYGGSIFAGLAGMDTIIEISKKVHVNTIIDGVAASAGTFLSIVGTNRLMKKHGHILIHQLSSGFWGKYNEIKDSVENLDHLMDVIRGMYKEYTSVPVHKLDKILSRDIWWDAKTCLKYDLVDSIIS